MRFRHTRAVAARRRELIADACGWVALGMMAALVRWRWRA